MTFITDWNSQQITTRKDEISLFRLLAKLLAKHYHNIEYLETHGQPGFVEFVSQISPGVKKKREISDLIIIAYSRRRRIAKYTIHQVKYDRNVGIKRQSPAFDFRGELYQYDLLYYRPDIIPVPGSIQFPTHILSNASHVSVCSYGVFFTNHNRLIDYTYSASRWLTPASYAKRPKLLLNEAMLDKKYGEDDLTACIGLQKFVQALLDLHVGTLIGPNSNGRFIASVLASARRSSGSNTPDDFFDQFDFGEPIDIKGSFRILAINVDENS